MTNKTKILPLLLALSYLLVLQSCISYESMVNYKQGDAFDYNAPMPITNQKKVQIQANDVLDIKVHSHDLITASPFNLVTNNLRPTASDPSQLQLNGYLVDSEGHIDFPVIGKWNVQGLTVQEAREDLLEKLSYYLKNPVVNIRFLNFKITIAGEVNRPGTFTVYSERISMPELIAMAGGMTPYANRDSILIVREENHQRSYGSVSMATNQFFESEYYYLQQNDYIYIEPTEAKRGAVNDNSNKVLPFVSAVVSIAALLISAFK